MKAYEDMPKSETDRGPSRRREIAARTIDLFTEPNRAAALRLFALFALTGLLLVCCVHGRRAFQLWCFTAPFALALIYAANSLRRTPDHPLKAGTRAGRIFRTAVCAAFAICWIDAGIRGFVRDVYASDPESGFVLEAVANTNAGEAFEYVLAVWPDILKWSAAVFAVALVGFRLIHGILAAGATRRKNAPAIGVSRRNWRRPVQAVFILFLAASSIISWTVRPWRIQLPPLYWIEWIDKVGAAKAQWLQTLADSDKTAETAQALISNYSPLPQTLVLVVGESTVRDRLSLYGYERNTTPSLDRIDDEDPKFFAIRHAWSADGSTLDAFQSMFMLQTPEDGSANVFALFKAAGYRIIWISNQDDLAIKTQFAHWADEQIFINRLAGRSSASLDEKVIAPLEKALADKAPRKLIVVHLIGAHPHYSLRYPPDWKNDWPVDQIDEKYEALNRSPWVIKASNTYDTVMRYQDEVIAGTLMLSQASAAATGIPLNWLYIADHGQELGDSENRTGHTQTTPGGYRIPCMLWLSDAEPRAIEERPFRSDWLSPLLLELADIDWHGKRIDEVLVSDLYRWRPPMIPAKDPELEAVTERFRELEAQNAS